MITEYRMSRTRRNRAWRITAGLAAAVLVTLTVGAAIALEGDGRRAGTPVQIFVR